MAFVEEVERDSPDDLSAVEAGADRLTREVHARRLQDHFRRRREANLEKAHAAGLGRFANKNSQPDLDPLIIGEARGIRAHWRRFRACYAIWRQARRGSKMPGDAVMNGILSGLLDESLAAARKRKLIEGKVPPISLVMVESGTRNAACYKLREGDFLITVNEGTMILIHLLSKVVAACLPLEKARGRFLSFSTDQEKVQAHMQVNREIQERFLDVMLAHYVLAEPWVATPWFLTTPQIAVANILRDGAERFVVTHEAAHCLFGHLETSTPADVLAGRVPEPEWSRHQELDADLLALQWSALAAGDQGIDNIMAHGACDFALILGRLDEKILGEYSSATHPSAGERLAKLRAFYGGHGGWSDQALRFSLTIEFVLDVLWAQNKREFYRRAKGYREGLRSQVED